MAKTARLTRSAFLARLAARPTALRLGQFDELDPMEEVVALVEQAGGDISTLSPDELTGLREGLLSAYNDIRPTVQTPDQVEALRTVVEAMAHVDGEIVQRETQAAEVEAALAALDAEIEAPAGAPAGESDPAAGDAAPAGEPGAAGAPAEGTPAGDAAPAAGAAAAEPPAAGDPAAPEGTPAGPEGEQVSAAAVPRRPPLSVLSRQSRRNRPEANNQPDTGTDLAFAPGRRIVASANYPEVTRGEAFTDPDQLGRVIASVRTELAVPSPTDKKHYLGRMQLPERPRVVRADDFPYDENGSKAVIDAAVAANRQHLDEGARLVASGGIGGVPPMPDYTITLVGDRGATWSDRVPTVEGTRPIKFFPNILMSLRDTAGSRVGARPTGGIGVVTAAQDLAGYGNGGGQHAPKDCVHIDAPSTVDSVPEAMFRCTTVGNFQAITFPEYVRAFDEIVGFYFDVERDEKNLGKFVSAAKHLHASSGATFGAARDLLDVIRRYTAHIRSVRKVPHMPMNFDLPAFARAMVAQDLADSWSDGSTNMRITPEQALALLAVDEGITIGEYDVSIGLTANGSKTVLPELATNTTLGAWPDQIRILAYPDGAIWLQNYGSLSFGLRETGMTTNDFSGFFELFEQFNTRTTDLATIDIDLCVNGAFGAAISKTCVAVTSE